jgi:hypothetical protein
MQLDTHFLKFEFLDYNNVKPLKNKFSINSNLALHVFDSFNHAPNLFKMQHKWNFQINFFDLLYHNRTKWQILQSKLKVGF